jgi:hypothetical protein
MPSDAAPLDALETSFERAGEAREKLQKKPDAATRFQFTIAVVGVVLTAASVWNNWKIGTLSDQQDKLNQLVTQQQAEINIGTSMLHETMLILDTKDETVLKEKVTAQTSLILTLIDQADKAGAVTGDGKMMQPFYTKLLDVLLAALPAKDAQELHQYVADQTAQPGNTEPAAPAAPAAVMATATVSPEPFPHGEAAAPGKGAQDYDVFWCVAGTPYPELNANETMAETVYRDLVARQDSAGLGRIRLRRLPDIVNQTAGFWIKPGSVTIRAPTAKSAAATTVQSWVGADLQAGHPAQKVTIGSGGATGHGPLDIFVCPS